MPRKRFIIPAAAVIAVVALALLWNWDWFVPLANRQASAALGRPVTIQHLHVHLARMPEVSVEGLVIGNPDGFPAADPLATVARVSVQADALAYIKTRAIVLTRIEVDHPVIAAQTAPDGSNNYTLAASNKGDSAPSTSPAPQIGGLKIVDGHVHFVDPKLKSDFEVAIATSGDDAQPDSKIVADAKGTYDNQPVTGHFVGGALLSLRDQSDPYPIDLHVANGPTKVSLVGTIKDPLAFAGANVKLEFSGPDLSLLYPLTGIPIPATPPFQLAGNLDYENKRIRFHQFAGKVGSSDLEGDIDVDPGSERPHVIAKLASRQVDLTDLGGFIGSTPGRAGTPNQTPQQRAALARAEASPRLIPDSPINLPKVRAADVDLTYRGAHIEGRSIPLDNLVVDLTLKDGRIDLHPISFGVGKGAISGNIALDGQNDRVNAKADISFKQVDVGRLMSATHTFGGAGTLGGNVEIAGSGNSLAAILGDGNGGVKLFMVGGNLSSLLVDLSGLEFGNALLSALGIPSRATVRCLITDFVLQHGQLNTRTLLLDTTEANVNGTGSINLNAETIDYKLRTEAKHFSIGSLPADINVTGKLKSPSVLPDMKELGIRGAAAVGLGVLLTPLGALLPTIQLGLGEDNDCGAMIHTAQRTPEPVAATAPARPQARGRPPREADADRHPRTVR